MRMWEIWKRVGAHGKESLHHRYETRAERDRVLKEMKRQEILCWGRKRKAD